MSSLLVASKLDDFLSEKEVFLDTDFLLSLYKSKQFLAEVVPYLIESYPIIDSFVSFEFLRNVVSLKEIEARKKFLADEIFYPFVEAPAKFEQVKTNALILSGIYHHDKSDGAGPIDLFIAARTMLGGGRQCILTGNKKHFPSCVFDVIAIFSWESKKEITQTYLIKFNQEKVDECLEKIKRDLHES